MNEIKESIEYLRNMNNIIIKQDIYDNPPDRHTEGAET